ncbi:MAG: hypothetical protein QXG12_07960 [Thermoproteota archaeon]
MRENTLDLVEKVGFRVTSYELSRHSEISKLIDELKSETVSRLNVE